MAWTAPKTWLATDVPTALEFNQQMRDNFAEEENATALAAGDLIYADAANSMGSRLAHPGAVSRILVSSGTNALAWRLAAESILLSDGAISGTTNSTSYSGRTSGVLYLGVGTAPDWPSVTVTTGVLALVIVSAMRVSNDTAGGKTLIAFSVSGTSTVAASAATAALEESSSADDQMPIMAVRLIGLTAGSNTFQFEAAVTAGLATIDRPRICVWPF